MNETAVVRRSHRVPVAATAKLRVIRGVKFDILVTNLTSEGCCVVAGHLNLRTGDYVCLKITEMEYLPSIVRWSTDAMAGLEFTRPLYEPVTEHLQAKFHR